MGSIIPAPNFLLFLAFISPPLSPISLIWPRPKTRRAALSEVIPPSIQPCADTERTETDMDASSRGGIAQCNQRNSGTAGRSGRRASVRICQPPTATRAGARTVARHSWRCSRSAAHKGPGPNATRAAPTPRTPPEPKKKLRIFLIPFPPLSPFSAPLAQRADWSGAFGPTGQKHSKTHAQVHHAPALIQPARSTEKKTLRDIQLRLYASCQVK